MAVITDKSKIALPIPLEIQNIEMFLEAMELRITMEEQNQEVKRQFPIKIRTPSTFQDAVQIVEIYNAIYHGHYPYKEMLDPDYVYETFSRKEYFWEIFELEMYPEENNEVIQSEQSIVGCCTTMVDFNHRRAYLRGLNVRPEFQGKIKISDLISRATYQTLKEIDEYVDKWYNECRTAHSISQYISTLGGAHTYSIFPNKDIFLKKKECDVLMVAYKDEMIQNSRTSPYGILSEVEPFYKDAIQHLNLTEDSEIQEIQVHLHQNRIKDLQKSIKIYLDTDEFGYVTFRFVEPKNQSYFRGLFTPMARNIEKIEFQAENEHIFAAFIALLKEFITQYNIEYCEMFIPVSQPEFQKILLINQMKIFGYVPAWSASKSLPGYMEDNVIFGFTSQFPDREDLKLIDQGDSLWNNISNQYREELEEKTVFSEEFQSNIIETHTYL